MEKVRQINAGYDITSLEEIIKIKLIGLKQNGVPMMSGHGMCHLLLLLNDRLVKGTVPTFISKGGSK